MTQNNLPLPFTPEPLDCGHNSTPSQYTPGYGKDSQGKKYCYDCCAAREKEAMQNTGKTVLYLTHNKNELNPFYEVTDWPGKLRFKVRYMRKGRHNIARTRYDVWFDGPGGNWYGVQYGENTQVVHCKRVRG